MSDQNQGNKPENLIKSKALEIGFSACGISTVRPLHAETKHLMSWIESGYNGELHYMARNVDKRENPTLLFPNAKSVISVLLNYFPKEILASENGFSISKYAYGIDYHYVIKDKLKILQEYIINGLKINTQLRSFTDSAPIFDKALAQKAGLGWIGKNSMLIDKKIGSYFFIGEIISDYEFEADQEFRTEHCGTCTRCMEACPTKAIISPYTIDATKCISYQTIENKKLIPDDIASKMQDIIFGCDICQDVCPWNRKSQPNYIKEFNLSSHLSLMQKEDWMKMNNSEFKNKFKSSPLFRPGLKKLTQTIQQIQYNVKKY